MLGIVAQQGHSVCHAAQVSVEVTIKFSVKPIKQRDARHFQPGGQRSRHFESSA